MRIHWRLFTPLVLISTASCMIAPVAEDSPVHREAVRQVVASHHREVEACYLEAIARRPGAEGKLVMVWDIDADGSAGKVEVKSADAKIAEAGPCLVREISTWKFPKHVGGENGAAITYPFVFSENGAVGR